MSLNASPIDACADLGDAWFRHQTLPSARIAEVLAD